MYAFIHSLDKINISKSHVSYLTTMSIRIWYMHKVLKDIGSFYLHCDSTMSHYLKIICDLIFGEKNFRNEISWCYRKWSISQKQFVSNHDVIIFYSKSSNNIFNTQYVKLSEGTLKRWKGKKQKAIYSENGKRLSINEAEDSMGSPMADWWEISVINPAAKERLGYPTQKPEALLERIIKASSNEGDLVADFFCGCGTSIAVAEKLKRNWIGVDISHLAIKLILDRLTKPFGKSRAKEIKDNIEILGFPRDIASAKELAQNTESGRFNFQDWIIEVMLGGVVNPKKTADGGFDGYLTFNKVEKDKGVILVEVKSGKIGIKQIREFIQVVNSRNADMGVLVCFKEFINNNMLREAKLQGNFQSEYFHDRFDKIQIISVEDLLDGKDIHLPSEFFVKDTFQSCY